MIKLQILKNPNWPKHHERRQHESDKDQEETHLQWSWIIAVGMLSRFCSRHGAMQCSPEVFTLSAVWAVF